MAEHSVAEPQELANTPPNDKHHGNHPPNDADAHTGNSTTAKSPSPSPSPSACECECDDWVTDHGGDDYPSACDSDDWITDHGDGDCRSADEAHDFISGRRHGGHQLATVQDYVLAGAIDYDGEIESGIVEPEADMPHCFEDDGIHNGDGIDPSLGNPQVAALDITVPDRPDVDASILSNPVEDLGPEGIIDGNDGDNTDYDAICNAPELYDFDLSCRRTDPPPPDASPDAQRLFELT